MSPHAEFTDSSRSSWANGSSNGDYALVNGSESKPRSHLQPTPVTELHDLVCVGFGPASLSIAVALHDAVDDVLNGKPTTQLKSSTPKVAFLERQNQFAWHAGMQIPGAKMQISFLKDLATFRNPRSHFTFINYLHQNDRLVQFTNLSTFLPRRVEYEDYMRWASKHFDDLVSYGEEVVDISADQPSGAKAVSSFTITSRNIATGELTSRRTKKVVVAVGGRPKIPKALPERHPRVIHSSQYWTVSSKMFRDPNAPIKVAVLGCGQSAAEIFENLPSQFPNSKSYLMIRGAALRPSDDSPFVNEVFDPDRVDDVYGQDPDVRAAAIVLDRATNYGVVRLELIEHLYDLLYTQRLKYKSEAEWPQLLLNHREVEHVSDLPNDRVRLHIRNDTSKYKCKSGPATETLDVDLVIVAAGYERNAHEELLQNARHLMPGGGAEGQKWTVGRDYRVQFENGAVADDAGVYLQGCNEKTHGLSDSLLSIIAVRGGEMVQNMFGETKA